MGRTVPKSPVIPKYDKVKIYKGRKECPFCGGSPVEKDGAGYKCTYCDRWF